MTTIFWPPKKLLIKLLEMTCVKQTHIYVEIVGWLHKDII